MTLKERCSETLLSLSPYECVTVAYLSFALRLSQLLSSHKDIYVRTLSWSSALPRPC